jgi:two-component system cell cycle sensor histidine kinase PleC
MPSWFGSQRNLRDAIVVVVCTALTFGIFCFDLWTPADNVSVGFAYDSVIFLTFLVRYRRLYFPYAAVATALVMIGCFFPLPDWDHAPVFFANRALAVMSLWLIAYLIHYRTQAEAALVRMLETSQLASQSKSQFLASMSHELRAPLTGVLGFSEIIKSEMLGPIANARYVQYAGYIHQSGEHMLSLINDVLDIAKIEAGRMELYPEWINVQTFLEYVTDLGSSRAADKGLSVSVDGPERLQLYADVRAIKQIALNLLSNAIKFTPAGGHISVTAAAVADGGITLVVRDTGIGMSHETIDRLMRPFEQADNRFGIAEKGSGLGLSLVKGLMDLHRGRMTIESQPGQGSVFTLYFPPGPPTASGNPNAAGT